MKLLVLTASLESSTLDPGAGWMHELTSRLCARGHRVTVLCTRSTDPRDPPEDPPGVTVWRPAERDRASVLSALLALSPDVVHVAATGPLDPETTAALARAPVLIDLVDWAALCPAGDLLARPHGQACALHFPAAPCGTCVGHLHVRGMEPFLALARGGHRVVAHSGHARDRATTALGRGVALVPVGVDATHFAPEPSAPLSPDLAAFVSDRSRPRVVTLGPPTPARGGEGLLDLLVALHARRPGVELVVPGIDPGNPDLLHILLAEAKELGVGNQLRAIPRVSHADLPALLAACEVGLAPGLAPEPHGRAVAQALAVGLPIVAHPSETMKELLLGGAAGVMASASPLGPFADAIARLLASPAERNALGERARLAALEHHDLDRALFDTEALYERVRSGRTVRPPAAALTRRRAAA